MTPTVARKIHEDLPQPASSDARKDRRLLEGYLHKTSNTLCGIKGYASLIADREIQEGEAGRWARKIIAEVERMEDIFRSVGDLTRGRRHPDIGVDLPGFVAEVAHDGAAAQPGLNLRVISIPGGELRLPAGDLHLLLSEVLKNCAESAASAGGPVEVTLEGRVVDGNRVFLTVTDDGCGMDPELTAMAAAPFVSTKDGHHGVGLTRIETLMDMYGLQWSLTSETGEGTIIDLEVAEGY